jgi:hypothetical protein
MIVGVSAILVGVAGVAVVITTIITITITQQWKRDISDTANRNRKDVTLNERKIYMVEIRAPMNDLQEEHQEVVTKYTPVTQAIIKRDIKISRNYIPLQFHYFCFPQEWFQRIFTSNKQPDVQKNTY